MMECLSLDDLFNKIKETLSTMDNESSEGQNLNEIAIELFNLTLEVVMREFDNTSDASCVKVTEIFQKLKLIRLNKSFDWFTVVREIDLSDIETMPLHVLWWFKQINVMDIEVCYTKLDNIINQILKLLVLPCDILPELPYHPKNMAADFIATIIMFRYCRKRLSGYLREVKKLMCYCTEVMDAFIDVIIEESNNDYSSIFIFIDKIHEWQKKRLLNNYVLKQFYQDIFEKIISRSSLDFNMLTAYTFQKALKTWIVSTLRKHELLLLQEICLNCKLSKLDSLMMEREETLNWMYYLCIYAIFVTKVPNGPAQIKEMIDQYILDAFRRHDEKKLMIAFIIAREKSLEKESFDEYGDWFSNLFGTDTKFFTSLLKSKFEFLIKSLKSFIPYEPEEVLQIHLTRALQQPLRCNYLKLEYKALLKSRMAHLKHSKKLRIFGGQYPIEYLLEPLAGCNKSTFALRHVCGNHCGSNVTLLCYINVNSGYENVNDIIQREGLNA